MRAAAAQVFFAHGGGLTSHGGMGWGCGVWCGYGVLETRDHVLCTKARWAREAWHTSYRGSWSQSRKANLRVL